MQDDREEKEGVLRSALERGRNEICGAYGSFIFLLPQCESWLRTGWSCISRSSAARTAEMHIEGDRGEFHDFGFDVDPGKIHSLAELIDLAESHNPQTRVAWERARAQMETRLG